MIIRPVFFRSRIVEHPKKERKTEGGEFIFLSNNSGELLTLFKSPTTNQFGQEIFLMIRVLVLCDLGISP